MAQRPRCLGMPAWAGRTGADAEINVNHVLLPVLAMAAASATAEADVRRLELIEVSADGTQFVGAQTGRRFLAWGCNYDHDESGRLLDDYWVDEWERVEEDFAATGLQVDEWHTDAAGSFALALGSHR